MMFLMNLYMSTTFWTLFAVVFVVMIVSLKMNRLHLLRIPFVTAFAVMFIMAFVGMFAYEITIKNFAKSIRLKLAEIDQRQMELLMDGNKNTLVLELTMQGKDYTVEDVDLEIRRVFLMPYPAKETVEPKAFPFREVMFRDYSLGFVERSPKEEK